MVVSILLWLVYSTIRNRMTASTDYATVQLSKFLTFCFLFLRVKVSSTSYTTTNTQQEQEHLINGRQNNYINLSQCLNTQKSSSVSLLWIWYSLQNQRINIYSCIKSYSFTYERKWEAILISRNNPALTQPTFTTPIIINH